MQQKKITLAKLKEELEKSDSLQEEFKQDPLKAIEKFDVSSPIFANDVWIYRGVVGVLGLVILSVVLGVIYIMTMEASEIDQKVPTMLTATCSAALGALTGLLVPTPGKKD